MAAACTQTQMNTNKNNSSPTTPVSHEQYSNYGDFRLSTQISNDFDGLPLSPTSSSSSSSPSSSTSSPSEYSNTSMVNGDGLAESNSKSVTQLNNELTITNNMNASMKRILQEINNNSSNTNSSSNGNLSSPSNINSNKSNDMFFDMMINANSSVNAHRTASFSSYGSENNQNSPYFNQHEQLNLKENLNNLVGSFINSGENQRNHFFPQSLLMQPYLDSNSKAQQQIQDVFSRGETMNNTSNQYQRIKEEQDFLANCMRKRVYSCSTIDFEFLNKTRGRSESFNPNSTVTSSPAHDSSNNVNLFNRQNSLTNDAGDEILASSLRNSIIHADSSNIENFKSFRHNSIIGTNNSTNIQNNNNNTSLNNTTKNASYTKENRALSFSFSSNNSNQKNSINSNSYMHINKPPYINQNQFYKNEMSNYQNNFPCLSPNCLVLSIDHSDGNIDQNLIKFGCNSCQTIRYMHGLCYKKSCLEQLNINNSQRNNNNKFNPSKSFDGSKYQEQQLKMVTIKFSCTICMNGVLSKHQSLSKSKIPTSPLANSNQNHQQTNFDQSNNNNNNGMNLPWRKKSLCLNNPPLPVPMQPVRESSSRSPSPSNQMNHQSTYQNNSNQAGKSNNTHNQLAKRQSAPVNVPKNRCRTMSTGSTSSFSASSSFSSSVGGASFSIGSPLNPNMNGGGNGLWKKGANQHASPLINNNNNSNHHLSSNNLNNSSNSQEANIKTDAECLNNMLATMTSKLHLTDTGRLEEKLASTGNIFYSRGDDYSIFNKVPFIKQNAIMLRLEDEGPYGNDETRCFVLSHFSSLCIREMKCVICDCKLAIYDKFPLLDGTLFVSPIKYTDLKSYAEENVTTKETSTSLEQDNTGSYLTVPAYVSNKNQFIYAICLSCLHSKNGHEIKCKFCKQAWKGGQTLQIGTMYKYEIFSAFPCCQKKLNCSKCDFQIVNLNTTGGLQYFSSYSEERECIKCKTKDFHFIKPLNRFYDNFKS